MTKKYKLSNIEIEQTETKTETVQLKNDKTKSVPVIVTQAQAVPAARLSSYGMAVRRGMIDLNDLDLALDVSKVNQDRELVVKLRLTPE